MSFPFILEFIRTIKKSFGRFLSIVAIVALGVAFYSGIKATAPDMQITADNYYDELAFFDVKLLSTWGFDKSEVSEIAELKGIKRIMPAYFADLLIAEDDKQVAAHVMSYSFDNQINMPKIHSGRLPQKSGEVFVDSRIVYMYGYKTGDEITLLTDGEDELSDKLKRDTFVIVGIGESPLYISSVRDAGTVGQGVIDGFLLVPEEDFAMDIYTEIYIVCDNKSEISRFSKEYDKAVTPLKDSIKEKGDKIAPTRFDDIKKEVNDELLKGEKKLDDGETEYKDGKAEYDENLEKFNAEIKKGEDKINSSQKELFDAEEALLKGQNDYDQNIKKFKEGKAEYSAKKAEYDNGKSALVKFNGHITDLKNSLSEFPEGSAKYMALKAQIDAMEAEYNVQKQQLDAAKLQIEAAGAEIEKNEKLLSDAKNELDEGFKKIKDGKTELEKGRAELNKQKKEGVEKLTDAEQKLADARIELDDGWKEYNEENENAQKELADLKNPKWYVLDPNQLESFADYKANCERIDAIGQVFPLIFFLVAVLVSLTGMTRMVEQERQQIGIFKALGYSKAAIASKYIVYALIAGGIGCAIGYSVGFTFFPRLIAGAYGSLYHLPTVVIPFNGSIAAVSGVSAILCATLPALFVCLGELHEQPSTLMLPKAPKAGKRIFLEHITPIWKRISFTYKVTLRNLFRYKKRLLMTIIGIAGCTALLYTGFGVYSSVSGVVALQFNEVRRYDMVVTIKENATDSEFSDIQNKVKENENIKSALFLHQQSIDVIKDDVTKNAYLVSFDNQNNLKEMISVKERTTKKDIDISDGGVVITEKLASILGYKKGDTITLKDANNNEAQAKILGISENYVFHYVYMSNNFYRKIFNEAPTQNQILGLLSDMSDSTRAQITENMLLNKAVGSVEYNVSIKKDFNKMINALVYVVFVLIISAAALAFVVLLSLTTINIDERCREIASLKVLGFTMSETAIYVFREGFILSAIGAALGLWLGYFVHHFVIITAELDMIMFMRETKPLNMVISFIMTMFFSGTVHLFMLRKLNKIDMVSSLKSVD